MAYEITRRCNGCGACQSACSMDAIRRSWGSYTIDPDLCDSCGACAFVCPKKAIDPD
ncbi:MAG: 4Fe-4S binding protein [Clostridiales bacterium]|nr:4Fe-4S binding protein [Clostridiales bacterium]